MPRFSILISLLTLITYLMACGETELVAKNSEPSPLPWWSTVSPVLIEGDAYYGGPCSITRVSNENDGASVAVIFEVPARLFTYCLNREPAKNYLSYDGEYIILKVDRQTIGAGSSTAERYRSADFSSWQEYIGVTWLDGEAHEAWRNLGSTSSKADAVKKITPQ